MYMTLKVITNQVSLLVTIVLQQPSSPTLLDWELHMRLKDINLYHIMCNNYASHTLLIDNHVGLHSFQKASHTGAVCDLHLRLTAKPHIYA